MRMAKYRKLRSQLAMLSHDEEICTKTFPIQMYIAVMESTSFSLLSSEGNARMVLALRWSLN